MRNKVSPDYDSSYSWNDGSDEGNWEMVGGGEQQEQQQATTMEQEADLPLPPRAATTRFVASAPPKHELQQPQNDSNNEEMTIEFTPSTMADTATTAASTTTSAPEETRVAEPNFANTLTNTTDDSTTGLLAADPLLATLTTTQQPTASPSTAAETTLVESNNTDTPPSPSSSASSSLPFGMAADSIAKTWRNAARRVKKTVRDIDQKHHIRETTGHGLRAIRDETLRAGKTVSSGARKIGNGIHHGTVKAADTVSSGARKIGKSIHKETVKATDSVKRSCVQHDVPGKAAAAAQSVQQTAKSVGHKAKEFNDRYHVVETVASTAAAIGALSLAHGNVRGGAISLGVAGAAIASSEALRSNENLHMD